MNNWPRWTFASASKHFSTAAAAYPIALFIEGTDRQTNTEVKWLEFRMDGPRLTEVSRNYYRLDVEINMFWSANMDQVDFHEPYRLIGLLQTAMTDICVYRYGDGPDDDDSFLGTLQLVQDRSNPIRMANFGQILPDTKIVQGTVEGTYKMYLTP